MLIPAPKIHTAKKEKLHLKKSEHFPEFNISAGKKSETATVRVIRQELKRLIGRHEASVSVSWKDDLVKVPRVPGQAYELGVNSTGIAVRANTAVGALYGVSALRQLKTAPGTFQTAEIRDWPDTEIRIAGRTLLCAECCSSALDWGDGTDGFIRRWKAEIDFALRFRFNSFFAWGFSWDTEPFPGFGRCFRIINAYARARGVKLCFGGLGTSRFNPGRVRILSDSDRRSRGLGISVPQTVPCSKVDTTQQDDVFCGTCRSNAALRAQKIKDMAAFVKAVEPAMLYIHHEDMNTIEGTQKYVWDCRCPECRKKWPDDRMESPNGGAGAIADVMNSYSEALGSVPESPSGYNAMRDCVILYTSPGYGDWSENAEQWNRVKTLWKNVVSQLHHPENFAITVREQFRNENDPGLRVEELSQQIRSIAPQCGVHVFVAGGADLYFNNAPFSPAAEMYSACKDARAVFTFNGITFQRPLQMFNAECLWNMSVRPGSLVKELPPTREECNLKLKSMLEAPLPPEYHDPAGWLAQACRYLFGAGAGEKIFRYQLLRSPSGCYPLSILYYEMRMRRKLFTIMTDPETDCGFEKTYWRETVQVSREGYKLIREALEYPGIPVSLRRELEYQAKCLETGITLSEAAEKFFTGERSGYLEKVKNFRRLAESFPRNFLSSEEGDSSYYELYADRLSAMAEKLRHDR